MSRQKRKKQLAGMRGAFIHKHDNEWWVFHTSWHWLADWIRCKTKREAINVAYKISFPSKACKDGGYS